MSDRERALVEAAREAATILEGYMQFLTQVMPFEDIELHPYVPHVELVGDALSAALSQYEEPKQ